MKLLDRCKVEGTEPPIQIGHRVRRDKYGNNKIIRTWSAQFSIAGRHHYESLGTTNKAVAIQKAHAIAQRLAHGEQHATMKHVELSEMVEQYLSMQADRGGHRKRLQNIPRY